MKAILKKDTCPGEKTLGKMNHLGTKSVYKEKYGVGAEGEIQ
jgi:hypothetical protein